MALDTATMAVLSAPLIRTIFELVAKERTINFKDLAAQLQEKQIPKEEVSKSLETLKEVSLIKEHPASLEDFNTLYITADGLSAERQLRRLGGIIYETRQTR
jgi:DNA-binding transcriptional ArsR family regulator